MATGFWAGSRQHVLAALSIYTIGAVLVAAVLGGLFVYAGLFNVSALVPDQAPLQWLFVTTREASIGYHAKGIIAPAPTGAAQVDNGFRLFQGECSMCHSIRGFKAGIMSVGLNPPAPPLADLIDMTDAETFWVVKNGIRFTGMPGWQASNTDAELWNIVAFLMSSKNMQEADFVAMGARLGLPAMTK
ncbi:MAG: cytochrome c [Paracoccaceae bacterium]